MKKTAVQVLLNELQRRLGMIQSEPNGIVRETMIDNLLIDSETSLETEKQQIVEFADSYSNYTWQLSSSDDLELPKSAEEYYKETYED